jgi:hypothetical protein
LRADFTCTLILKQLNSKTADLNFFFKFNFCFFFFKTYYIFIIKKKLLEEVEVALQMFFHLFHRGKILQRWSFKNKSDFFFVVDFMFRFQKVISIYNIIYCRWYLGNFVACIAVFLGSNWKKIKTIETNYCFFYSVFLYYMNGLNLKLFWSHFSANTDDIMKNLKIFSAKQIFFCLIFFDSTYS